MPPLLSATLPDHSGLIKWGPAPVKHFVPERQTQATDKSICSGTRLKSNPCSIATCNRPILPPPPLCVLGAALWESHQLPPLPSCCATKGPSRRFRETAWSGIPTSAFFSAWSPYASYLHRSHKYLSRLQVTLSMQPCLLPGSSGLQAP